MATDIFKKGSIEMLTLLMLQEEDIHGYQISQLIKERSGGLLTVQEGALYPLLYRMEANGYISGHQQTVETKFGRGRTRVVYHLGRCTRCFPSGMRQSHSGLSAKRKRLAEFSRINTLPAGHTVDREVINMENIGVTCDVCECCHNVSGCKCDLPQIKVTEQCTCDTQQVETPHYCQSYEKK